MWVQGCTNVNVCGFCRCGGAWHFPWSGARTRFDSVTKSPFHLLASFKSILCRKVIKQKVGLALFWFVMVNPGFGGRGVLPGVAIGSNLSPKTSKNR